MASRIPPLLDTYLRLPPETSLVLLSGVLGSTTNWLLLRYLHSLLLSSTQPDPAAADAEAAGASTTVVLVSFLRDYAFWKDGAGKLGTDLDGLSKKARFVFVDGLTALFRTSVGASPQHSNGNGNGHGPGLKSSRALSAPTLQQLHKELQDAVAQIRRVTSEEQKIVLVADQLDLLLAASGGDISSQQLRETLLDIRENVHSAIVTVSADSPLITSQTTSLEKEHAAFAISLAHDAHLTIGLRMLDTGTARDVSGVLRIAQGGAESSTTAADVVEERELLYYVAGDGGVRVFERG